MAAHLALNLRGFMVSRLAEWWLSWITLGGRQCAPGY